MPQWRQPSSRTFQHPRRFVELGRLSFSGNGETRAQKAKRDQFLSRRNVNGVSVTVLARCVKVKVRGIENLTVLIKEGIVLLMSVKFGREDNDLVVINLTQKAQQAHRFQPRGIVSCDAICDQRDDLLTAFRSDRACCLITALLEKLDRGFDLQNGCKRSFIKVDQLCAQPEQVVFNARDADARNDLRHQFVQCPADPRQATDPDLQKTRKMVARAGSERRLRL